MVCAPTLMIADRAALAVFGSTLKTRVPLPLCGCDVICIQFAVVDPCHEHPPPADTFTFPTPPACAKLIVDCATLNGQPDGCCTWNERVCTPFVTSIVPVRGGP